jgi:hypothetical protein
MGTALVAGKLSHWQAKGVAVVLVIFNEWWHFFQSVVRFSWKGRCCLCPLLASLRAWRFGEALGSFIAQHTVSLSFPIGEVERNTFIILKPVFSFLVSQFISTFLPTHFSSQPHCCQLLFLQGRNKLRQSHSELLVTQLPKQRCPLSLRSRLDLFLHVYCVSMLYTYSFDSLNTSVKSAFLCPKRWPNWDVSYDSSLSVTWLNVAKLRFEHIYLDAKTYPFPL